MATMAKRLAVLALLAVVLATLVSCGTCASAPSITSVSPGSATAGGGQFLLTVNGDTFHQDSMVNWNGSFRLTTFVSSHQLFAAIPAADIAQPRTVLIFVFNPPAGSGSVIIVSGGIGVISTTACNGNSSNAVSFPINP